MNHRLQYRYSGMGSADVGLSEIADGLSADATDVDIVEALLCGWGACASYQPAHITITNRDEMIAAIRERIRLRDGGGQ